MQSYESKGFHLINGHTLCMFRMHSLFSPLTLQLTVANMLTVWCGKCVENDNKSQSRELQNITIHSDGNIGSYFPLESVITYNTQQNAQIYSPSIFIQCLGVTFWQYETKKIKVKVKFSKITKFCLICLKMALSIGLFPPISTQK